MKKHFRKNLELERKKFRKESGKILKLEKISRKNLNFQKKLEHT